MSQPGTSPALIIVDGLGTILYCNAEATHVLKHLINGRTVGLPRCLRHLLVPNGSHLTYVHHAKRRYTVSQHVVQGGNGTRAHLAIVLDADTRNGRSALARAIARYKLSARECQVLDLVIHGLTSSEIASRLDLSPNTIKSFIRILMIKTAVSSPAALVAKLAL